MMRALASIALLAITPLCPAAEYEVPLFLSADNAVSRSVLRVYGEYPLAMTEQTIEITGYDDHGNVHGPVVYQGGPLIIGSHGIEYGNPSKNLPTGLGDGRGNWRLVLSALDNRLEVRAYALNRSSGGPLASLQELAQSFDRAPGRPYVQHYVPLDWSLTRLAGTYMVRIFNRTDKSVDVELQMVGAGAYGHLTLEPYAAVLLDEEELIEMMNAQWVFDWGTAEPGLTVRLRDEEATVDDVGAMVLSVSRSGALTNLSTPPVAMRRGPPPERPSSGRFDISLDFMEGLHEDWRELARYAADRLEQIVLADYPTTRVSAVCGHPLPAEHARVDDILIRVEWDDPGPTHIAGHAVICNSIRTSGFRGVRPNAGIVTIPWADNAIRDTMRAERVLVHEMLHVLGIGSGKIWEDSGYVHLNTSRPSFTGPSAVREFQRLFPGRYANAVRLGFTGVPLEPDGSHWRTTGIDGNATFTLRGDIMSPGGNRFQNTAITVVTVGALEDLGYEVDYTMADR